MKRSQWIGLLAVGAAAVLVAFYVRYLGAEAVRGGPAIPDQRDDDGSNGVVDESLPLFDAPVERAARLTVTEPVDEGATSLDGPLDVLERVLMVLVLRGQLDVEASAHPPSIGPKPGSRSNPCPSLPSGSIYGSPRSFKSPAPSSCGRSVGGCPRRRATATST